MQYLLDTHTFIWLLFEPEKLSRRVADILRDGGNGCFVSAVAFWEMATKIKIGKLRFENFELKDSKRECEEQNISILPVSFENTISYLNLPLFKNHRDPFDRMTIATAIERGFTLLSRDAKLPLYDGAGLLHLW